VKLTAKQEAFAQAVADGMTQADAYRKAYDAGRMKAESIQVNACNLMKNTKVSSRVAELRAKVAEKHIWTREKSVRVLSEIADDEESRNPDKVSAIKELNAMHGFLAPSKHEVDMRIAVNVNFD
jgi:phage terminase small subunit